MKPTEPQIAERARQIWNHRGQPAGQDTPIWLEAERQLSDPTEVKNTPSATEGRGNGKTQAGLSGVKPDPRRNHGWDTHATEEAGGCPNFLLLPSYI